jgi:hypothetical protein
LAVDDVCGSGLSPVFVGREAAVWWTVAPNLTGVEKTFVDCLG